MKDRTGSNIQNILPRNSNSSPSSRRTANADTLGGAASTSSFSAGGAGAGGNVSRMPSRRYYDPTLMSSSLYLPRDFKLKNKWRRWFYSHDPVVGMVLDTHVEMAHSSGTIICEDTAIKRETEAMFEDMDIFNMLPVVDLEFMKIGEVTLYDLWDDSKGRFVKTVIHNPDFIEVSASQLAPDDPVVELRPSTDLKRLVMSSNPRDIRLKKRIPKDILSRVATGRNIPLENEFTTRIARLSNPYDVRGTSMVDRLFRTLMYEDKLYEAQLTIADNFIFPLKIFKLGDPQTGWVPSEEHMVALQELIQQQHFDPHFSIIFHYGLQYEQHGLEGKILRLEREWDRIDKIKMVALGISQNFMYGETTFASANASLQVLLSRYQAKRRLFENKWIRKLLRYTAQKQGWRKRTQAELSHNVRFNSNDDSNLIIPEISWHKRLSTRDDQQYLSFLAGIYKDNSGPISTSSMLAAAGLDIEDEIRRKKNDLEIEHKQGFSLTSPAQMAGAKGGATPKAPGGAAPGAAAPAGGGLPPLGGKGGPEQSPAGGPPPPGGPGAAPASPAAFFKGLRTRIASLLNRDEEVQPADTQQPIDSEFIQDLKKGYSELKEEIDEVVAMYPELKDVFKGDELFLGVQKKAQEEKGKDKEFEGVLINPADIETRPFFETFNIQPFKSGFYKNIEFTFGSQIAEKIREIKSSIVSDIQKEVDSNYSSIEDLLKEFIGIFENCSGTGLDTMYHSGKLEAYKKTNYLAYKNFLRRQYNSQDSITSDGFVDNIVVHEHQHLFMHILKSLLSDTLAGKSIQDVDFSQVTSIVQTFLNVALLHMLNIGTLKGYEEQGFDEVVFEHVDPDLLTFSEPNSTSERIDQVCALGEGCFTKLYRTAYFTEAFPIYHKDVELSEGFNDSSSYSNENVFIENIPYIYSEYVNRCLSLLGTTFNKISFIETLNEVPDFGKSISKTLEDKELNAQLKLATLQKYSQEYSSKEMFTLQDSLYILKPNITTNFKKNFIKSIYHNLSKKIAYPSYDLPAGMMKDLVKVSAIEKESDGIYRISKNEIRVTDSIKNQDIGDLFRLAKEYSLEDSFMWDDTGKFISNIKFSDQKDYIAKLATIYSRNPEFIQEYYSSHLKNIKKK